MRALLLFAFVAAPALAGDLSPPPVMPTEEAEPRIVPDGFLDQALKVDAKNRIAQGRAGTPVSHRELFERMGRVDLLTQSTNRAQRRLWLAVSAGAVAVAAGVTGVSLLATAPKLASVECERDVRIYNEVCVPRAATHNISGTAVLVSGAVVATLLATLAWWSDPDVLNRDETASLVSAYNAQLAKRLRAQQEAKPQGLKVTPFVSPDGAGLVAALKF